MDKTRFESDTAKVPTRFGTLHVHCDYDAQGRPVEIRISTPGKHMDTAVDEALVGIGEAATRLLGRVA